MPRLIVHGFTISFGGYGASPDQSLEALLGKKSQAFRNIVSFIAFNFASPIREAMPAVETLTAKPTRSEQEAARKSFPALEESLKSLAKDTTEIEIEETAQKITVPTMALQLLTRILRDLGEGRPVQIVPIAAEMTTQAAAEMLGCSRPHVIKLLEQGKIPFTKIGKHRRVKFEDVMKYRMAMKEQQKRNLKDMMRDDEEAGLYDS
ncbi:MAG: helix-turn-helix domain-containing protein [Flavobacteriales bacterium]